GATEVTVGQFRQFVTESNYNVAAGQTDGGGDWQKLPWELTDNHPVSAVSWINAVDFCAWLSKKEGKTYRLPTEAEWEYSCRAGRKGARYCFGDDDAELEKYAWYGKKGGEMTQPVGQLKPNAGGLYDMHGNVWEWVQDNYDMNYYRTNPPKQDPQGPPNGERVHRGGGYWWPAHGCRAAFRGPNIPSFRSPD